VTGDFIPDFIRNSRILGMHLIFNKSTTNQSIIILRPCLFVYRVTQAYLSTFLLIRVVILAGVVPHPGLLRAAGLEEDAEDYEPMEDEEEDPVKVG
jgi:hypothetical protein